jgi:hypothetical protein
LVHRKTFEREKCNHHSEKTVKALLAILRDFQKGFALKNGVKLISFSLGLERVQLYVAGDPQKERQPFVI